MWWMNFFLKEDIVYLVWSLQRAQPALDFGPAGDWLSGWGDPACGFPTHAEPDGHKNEAIIWKRRKTIKKWR